MTKGRIKSSVAVVLLLAVFTCVPVQIKSQGILLANNYDGVNYDLSAWLVGYHSGYTFAEGAKFTINGTGDFNLTTVIMPLFIVTGVDGNPNPNNYAVSVVSDTDGQPSDNVIGSFTPVGVGLSGANLTFDIAGIVHGGMDYWLLFSPIAPDNGCMGWFFSMGWTAYETGYLARRWSSDGVATGDWTVSTGLGSVRPAFVIEGTEVVPEPNNCILLGLGLAALVFRIRRG